eukprot:12833215-Ditylum_brightwellii.AAC.1
MVLAQERTCSCVTEPELILIKLPRPIALLCEWKRVIHANVACCIQAHNNPSIVAFIMKQPGGNEGSEISNVGVEVVISPGSSSNNVGATLNSPRPTLSPNTKEEK